MAYQQNQFINSSNSYKGNIEVDAVIEAAAGGQIAILFYGGAGASGTANGYVVLYDSRASQQPVQIARCTNGVPATISTYKGAVNSGALTGAHHVTIKYHVANNKFAVYMDGVLVAVAADSTYTINGPVGYGAALASPGYISKLSVKGHSSLHADNQDASGKAIIDFNASHANQGALSKKNSVDLAADVTNKSLANLDLTANTKLAGIEDGAEVTTGKSLDILVDGTNFKRMRAALKTAMKGRFPHGGNLLFNPNFEQDGDFWNNLGSSSTIVTSSANAENGNKYLQIVGVAGAGRDARAADEDGATRYFEVNPGDVIVFGGKVYREGGDQTCRFIMAVTDKDKAVLTYRASTAVTVAAWTKSQSSYTAPAGAKYVYFYAEVNGGTASSTARFDGCFLKIARGGDEVVYSDGATAESLKPAEAGATVGARVGTNLKRADGATTITEADLMLNDLIARNFTLSGGKIRTASSGARIEITQTEITGYGANGTTKQFYLNASDGKAYAGGGNVRLDAGGLNISPGTSYSQDRAITFDEHMKLFGTHLTSQPDIAITTGYLRVGDLDNESTANAALQAFGKAPLSVFGAEPGASVNLRAAEVSGGYVVRSVDLALNCGEADRYISVNARIASSAEAGTAPITVASTTLCPNLNADLLDGNEASAFLLASGATLTDKFLKRDIDNSSIQINGSTLWSNGGMVELFGRDSASNPGRVVVTVGGYDNLGDFQVRARSATAVTFQFGVNYNGSVSIGSVNYGHGGDNTLSVKAAVTPPNVTLADNFQLYAADIVAGNAAPHFRTENGSVVRLYQQPAVADAAATALPALTGTMGTTGTALVDVGATFSQANINNNFRRLMEQANNLKTVAESVRSQLNTVLAVLRNAGLIAP